MKDYDVIVVGGGPAGSTCARFLGEKGLRVLLVDKATFPHSRGGHDLILEGDLSVLGPSVGDRLSKKSMLPLGGLSLTQDSLEGPPHSTTLKGFGFSRTQLDALLFEHASKAVEFREKSQVVGLVREEGKITGVRLANLSTKEVKVITCDVVVGADGPFSNVAEWIGADTSDSKQSWSSIQTMIKLQGEPVDSTVRIRPMLNHSPAYGWVVPLSPDTLSVGLSYPLAHVRETRLDLSGELNGFLSNPFFVSRNSTHSELVESVTRIHHAPSFRNKENVVLIGQAAGFGGSFLGETLSNDLLSAQIASDIIVQASENQYSPAILNSYSEKVQVAIGPRMEDSKNVQKWLGYSSLMKRGLTMANSSGGYHSFSKVWHCPEARKTNANPLAMIRTVAGY